MYASTLPRSNWLRRASIRLAWYRHMPASSVYLTCSKKLTGSQLIENSEEQKAQKMYDWSMPIQILDEVKEQIDYKQFFRLAENHYGVRGHEKKCLQSTTAHVVNIWTRTTRRSWSACQFTNLQVQVQNKKRKSLNSDHAYFLRALFRRSTVRTAAVLTVLRLNNARKKYAWLVQWRQTKTATSQNGDTKTATCLLEVNQNGDKRERRQTKMATYIKQVERKRYESRRSSKPNLR